jgi:hypothetical protein
MRNKRRCGGQFVHEFKGAGKREFKRLAFSRRRHRGLHGPPAGGEVKNSRFKTQGKHQALSGRLQERSLVGIETGSEF